MARWLVNNLGLMVLALFFGFGAWALSTLQDNPIVEAAVAVKVVKLGENRLDNVTWTGTLPVSVTAYIRAPRSVVDELQSSSLHIDVDLSKLSVGEHVIPLTPTITASPVSILSSQPMTALVKIERIAQVRLPVRISVVGTPALGFRTGTASPTPQTVVITGPQQVVSRVLSVNAIVSVDGARASVEQEVRVFPQDADGEIVSGVQLTPDSVAVRVPMEQLSNYRDLAVRVRPVGQPAEGYAMIDITADPAIVTVYGPVDAVQATKGYIETLDVVIENAKSDINERVGLNVPSGVSLVEDNQSTVSVHIRIQPLIGSRTIKRKPALIGMTRNYSSTISPDTVDILINGPLQQLNSLTDSDIRVELDVTGLPAGIHQLTPNVLVPDGSDITAQSVLPATIQVELILPETPTPSKEP
ncbi:MAG: CdaR family protein [Chloroflexi bacterium]|nr:CdaR family protein [Chloroflexota bacterium]